MQVIYSGKIEKVVQAVYFVNILFQDNDFWQSIAEKNTFDDTRYSGSDIVGFMRSTSDPIEVFVVRPKNPFTSATGYNNSRYPSRIFLYSHRLSRDIGALVETIVHECVHSADRTSDGNPRIDFGHSVVVKYFRTLT